MMFTCQVCNKTLELPKSTAANRKTCSQKCKSVLMRKTKTKYIKVNCLICGKTIEVPPSIAKTKKTCSLLCDAELRRKNMTGKTRVGKKRLPRTTVICVGCGKSMDVAVNNRIPQACSRDCWIKHIHTYRNCEICGKEIKFNKRNKRFCNRECQSKAQSLGLVKSHCSGNYGFRPDIGKTFRSSFEANFARVCEHFKWKWRYEEDCFKTKYGFYTPDFYIESRKFTGYVELRGAAYRSTKKANEASRVYKFRLKILYQSDFEREYNYLSDVINWEDSRSAVWVDVDPNIYEKRTCKCGKEFFHRISSCKIGRYCSRECSNKYKWEQDHSYVRRKMIDIVCSQCGKTFSRKNDHEYKFCSKECYWRSLRNDKYTDC